MRTRSRDGTVNTNNVNIIPKYLGFVSLLCAMIVIISGWFENIFISVSDVKINAGVLLISPALLALSIICEIYGYKHARKVIWISLLYKLLFAFFGKIVAHVPYPTYAMSSIEFNTLLNTNLRLILASSSSYLISAVLMSYILSKIKILTSGKYMPFRIYMAFLIASIIYVTCYYKISEGVYVHYLEFNILKLLNLSTIITLPFLSITINFLKKQEAIDVYDNNTKYNVFSLDTGYEIKNN